MLDVIKVAGAQAERYGVRDVLVATAGRGSTARRARRVLGPEVRIHAVGNPPDSHAQGLCLHPGLDDARRRELEAEGIHVVLRPCSVGQGRDWYVGDRVYALPNRRLPDDVTVDDLLNAVAAGRQATVRGLVHRVLNWFGEGGRVCIEIALMTADAGALPPGHRSVAIATPVDLRVAHTCMVLDLVRSQELFGGHFGIVDVTQVTHYMPLVVADVSRSARFYGEVVGFGAIRDDDSGHYAELYPGAGTLALADVAGLAAVAARTTLEIGPGSLGRQEISFGVDDLPALRDRLAAAGVAVAQGDRAWVSTFCDPDGHRVHVWPY